MRPLKPAALTSVAALSLALGSCTTMGNIPGPTTPITQSEAQMGAEAHPQLLAEFGGAMTGPHAQYVEQVGRNIAVQSGLGNAQSDFTVTLLNSSVNNAFAIPGGYVYTTRQLVTLMNNEAELAGVLGHEVGHVAARHSQRRQATAQQNTLLGAAGAILSGILLGDSSIGQQLSQGFLQGSQLLTLRFSRSQELQADELGIQYLNRAGYDPHAMATVLASLAAQNALDASLQGRDDATVPEWASTHPDPASRVQTARQRAAGGTGVTNRDTFLTRIDGLVYGDDPEQGIIEGRQFIHPVFRLSFTAPQGFYMVNGTRAVSINGQSGQGQLSTGPYDGNLDNYVRSVFRALGGNQQTLAPASLERTTVNGIPAAYGTARVNSGNGQVDVVVFAYEFSNNQAFHFATISQAGRSGTFTPMFNSMRRISQAEANRVVPRRIDVVTVRSGDTISSLASRMAFDNAKEQRFRVLNGLGSGDTLRAGQKVKIVVRGS
ncbi:M48 family metalloprotease [Pelagerythrobacter rhizovicinus]|uniref:LysM peptidoglycan-binding domain-containing protein n=1 Tax=Pelagerythrobacter rhizovicinus TaxID=2268576 RepID=A0A4Q2KRI2_9SPHN|nr:M48 family metalloprotease [Pelagerythrobacter rhizovicinus]RXZ65941.1 LysM peptidoglycan-binding domain-containing protein [Pelagerythrobacter rhizovicinus]